MVFYVPAPSSTLVFLIIFFLSAQLLTFLRVTSENYARCRKTFKCGNIQNISFPFWGGDGAEICGYPEFELTCQGEVPQISIMSVTYKVIWINMDIKAFTVARTDYLTNLCPRQLANTTLNDFFSFKYSWNIENLTLYYDCPKIAKQSSGFPSQFHCSNNGAGVINYYVTASAFRNLSAEVKGGLGNCRNNVIVPAFYTAVQAIENNPTPDNLLVPLAHGFGLKWSSSISEQCQLCSASGGICGYHNDARSFICYCPDHSKSLTCVRSGSSDGISVTIKLVIGFGAAVAGVAISSVLVMVFYSRHKRGSWMLMNFQRGRRKKNERIEAFIMKCGSDLAPKRYSYSDIKKVTMSFKEKLGEGGFGSVYKGKFPDGRLVAVKVLSKSKGDGGEFINEVASISRTSHVNVVAFVGFCYEGSMRALIYEFMPNGSLDKFIRRQGSLAEVNLLEQKTLFEIAVGIARGLEYLHQGCNTRILHLDIKPHNILLDENFCPKISDFGLAKLCERKESILSMISARGTVGYIAPELFFRNFGGVSYKCDVYSYGMMVLEMVGEKENIHIAGSTTNELNFPSQVYEHLQQEAYFNLQGITAEEEEITKKMIVVSLWCIQTNPSDRPSMAKVLEMLQGSFQSLAIPPRPFLFSPPRLPENSSSAISLLAPSITMSVSE